MPPEWPRLRLSGSSLLLQFIALFSFKGAVCKLVKLLTLWKNNFSVHSVGLPEELDKNRILLNSHCGVLIRKFVSYESYTAVLCYGLIFAPSFNFFFSDYVPGVQSIGGPIGAVVVLYFCI